MAYRKRVSRKHVSRKRSSRHKGRSKGRIPNPGAAPMRGGIRL